MGPNSQMNFGLKDICPRNTNVNEGCGVGDGSGRWCWILNASFKYNVWFQMYLNIPTC